MSNPAAASNQPNAPFASASLYVGDLLPEVTEALLFEIFSQAGQVASVRVCRDAATRRSLGYAYVNFHRAEDAERALDTMNFSQIRGKPCRIMWSARDPSVRKSGVGNVFVKNLAKEIDNQLLYDTFSRFGTILSCKVALSGKREPLGYGFVHFENAAAAERAINEANGKEIAGQVVSVAPFKSKRERGGENSNKYTNVYVKNLPEDITEAKLNELFGKYGEITSRMLAMDEKNNKARGFGFVNFKTPEQANAAVEGLNNLDLGGKKLFVGRAQRKEEREKELRDKFEAAKQERLKKFAGVNLYVKNLSDTIDDEKLTEMFKAFGGITSAKIMRDAKDKKTKGFGFVCFSSPEEATKAVTEMNGQMVDGKPLYVALAQRKDQRRAQLEQAYKQRSAMPAAPMYPPQQMFYPGMPQMAGAGFGYAPQMMRRGPWNQQPVGMGGMNPRAYQLMPMNGNQRMAGPPGAQAARGRGRGGPAPRGGPVNKPGAQPGAGRGGRPQAAQRPVEAAAAPEPQQMTVAQLSQALAKAPEENRKQMLGERLFPLIARAQPAQAGKITGMLLEMDNGELLSLLESPAALEEKITEAMAVLNEAEAQEAAAGQQ